MIRDRRMRRMLGYLRPYLWPHFTLAALCMLAFSATSGAMPFLVRHIFDDVFAQRDAQMLRLLPLVIIGVFVFRGLVYFGSAYLSEYVGHGIVADLRNALNRHILNLPLSFFQKNPSGTVVSRVTADVLQMRSALTDAVASVARDAASLVILVAVAFWHDWALALIAFVVFPLSVGPVVRLSRRLRRVARRRQVSLGEMTALLQETVQGNRVVKAFGMEEYEARRFAAENERLRRLGLKVVRIRSLTTPLLEILAALGIAGVVWYGGRSVIHGGRTQGEFLAFLTAVFLLYEPFKKLGKTNSVIQQGLAAADRVFEILDHAPEVRDRPGARELECIREGIELAEVGFRYGEEFVLRHVSFCIPAGRVVALVGESGAGKSTLADLLLRFYDVTEGAIRIDGVDIRDLRRESLRRQIALVTQHTFLFNDTVRANIAYGRPDTPLEAVIDAARAARAHDFIMQLPQGYDTVIGELGLRLSGGERQRIAIARAILKNAPILVLDEATSALDNASERLVQMALETLMEGRTTLVIAHRLSTVRRADRIVVLARGRVVEEGTHEQLLALDGTYRRLYDLQFAEPSEVVSLP